MNETLEKTDWSKAQPLRFTLSTENYFEWYPQEQEWRANGAQYPGLVPVPELAGAFTHLRQLAAAGYSHTADNAFFWAAEGAPPSDYVETVDCGYWPQEVCVECHGEAIRDGWYLVSDCVETYDGDLIHCLCAEQTEDGGIIWHEDDGTPDDIFFVDGYGYCHVDDTYFCEECQESHHDTQEPCRPENEGLEYVQDCKNHDYRPERVIAESPELPYSIGFEVEKTSANGCTGEGEYIGDFGCFFAYWEGDSSCGVEGVSNIFGLGQPEKFLDLIKYEDLLDEDTDSSCGGHVHLSCYGKQLRLDDIRPYAPLIYALYRFRLKNYYCCKNNNLQNGWHDKYVTIRENSHGLELRLVSKVKNRAQIIWRYELFSLIAVAMRDEIPFKKFKKMAQPLLAQVYDKDKLKHINYLAFCFSRYLEKGVVYPAIEKFI